MAALSSQTPTTPTELFCETTDLSYLRVGESGAPIVLLHGWSAFKEIWWSTMVALAPYVRVFAPDMPGHGGSPLSSSRQIPQVAERIAAFCAARGLDEMTLVGHSMGGNIALELALSRPDLVQQLVLVAPAAEAQKLPRYTRSYLGSAQGWATLRLSMVVQHHLGLFGRRVPHAHNGGFVRPALRRAAYHARHDVEALRFMLDALFANPIGPRLADIKVPTLVISGERDPLVPCELSRALVAGIPGARYAEIRNAAHNPMDERPREFARVLLEFLELERQQS